MSALFKVDDRVLVDVGRFPTTWHAGTIVTPQRTDGSWVVALDEGWSVWATRARLRPMNAVERLADLAP